MQVSQLRPLMSGCSDAGVNNAVFNSWLPSATVSDPTAPSSLWFVYYPSRLRTYVPGVGTHTHTHTRARTHKHTRTHARTRTHAHMRTHTRARTHARAHVRTRTRAHTCAHAHTRAHTHTPLFHIHIADLFKNRKELFKITIFSL